VASAGPAEPTPRPLGPHAIVLVGVRGGRYPHGNSLLVRGRSETLLVDPSLTVAGMAADALPAVDRVWLSHCHEDHLAGTFRFPHAACALHAADRPGLLTLDGMMAIYGLGGAVRDAFQRAIVEEFHWTARPDATALADGDVLNLGGARVRVVHAPGHTRGHCVFHVEPDDVLYLGDIDLSSFGPYYGDAWSSLEDFERTLGLVRGIACRWYATFHHVGVVERDVFRARLDRFAAVIADRERRLLDFLAVPRTLDEVAAHRFVYRPGDAVAWAEPVERRSMAQHLDRLERAGRVRRVDDAAWRAA
jgi:hydroxyacylglutathione hydrolase